jgi:PhzF family phenazine biosynthesis protein
LAEKGPVFLLITGKVVTYQYPSDGGVVMAAIYQVDSFTKLPFSGNPAGVYISDVEQDYETCIKIAREMNLSETAFPVRTTDDNHYRLRWFTPTTEVPMCGHATLATSWVHFTELGIDGDIYYETLSGQLKVSRIGDDLKMDFPSELPFRIDLDRSVGEALDCNGMAYYSTGTRKLLFEISDRKKLEGLHPDFSKMEKLSVGVPLRGLIVTCKGDGEFDFFSRYFAPWVGINEDPVTGSAHTVLGPFWSERLGKDKLRAYQASQRGGEIRLEILDGNRISIIGNAVTVIRGQMLV